MLYLRMPLSDFKQLETGFYIIWAVRYKTPAHIDSNKIAKQDPQMAKHDYYEPRNHYKYAREVPKDRVRTSWHRSEDAARAVLGTLNKEVIVHEWALLLSESALQPQQLHNLHILEISKEVCVFDGDSFQTLSGKKWPLADIEACIARFEGASEDEVLSRFGKHRRVPRACWQQCLCWLTCLCCFDSHMGCSKRA